MGHKFEIREAAIYGRHRVDGVGRGGGQAVFNQILTNQIPWNPVKIRLKSG